MDFSHTDESLKIMIYNHIVVIGRVADGVDDLFTFKNLTLDECLTQARALILEDEPAGSDVIIDTVLTSLSPITGHTGGYFSGNSK